MAIPSVHDDAREASGVFADESQGMDASEAARNDVREPGPQCQWAKVSTKKRIECSDFNCTCKRGARTTSFRRAP